MTQFSELIRAVTVTKHGEHFADDAKDFSLPGRLQRNAAERFPLLATRHGFRLWQQPAPKKDESLRIVIGVSTASRTDMLFLDELQTYLPKIKEKKGSVELFNTYYFQTLEEIQERVPGIKDVSQTPIIGVWKDGKPVLLASGAKARRELIESLASLEAYFERHHQST